MIAGGTKTKWIYFSSGFSLRFKVRDLVLDLQEQCLEHIPSLGDGTYVDWIGL